MRKSELILRPPTLKPCTACSERPLCLSGAQHKTACIGAVGWWPWPKAMPKKRDVDPVRPLKRLYSCSPGREAAAVCRFQEVELSPTVRAGSLPSRRIRQQWEKCRAGHLKPSKAMAAINYEYRDIERMRSAEKTRYSRPSPGSKETESYFFLACSDPSHLWSNRMLVPRST